MGIVRFEDENQIDQYLEWRKRNPGGFVLNLNTRSPNTKSTKKLFTKQMGVDHVYTQYNKEYSLLPNKFWIL
jgi:hypothetical protein